MDFFTYKSNLDYLPHSVKSIVFDDTSMYDNHIDNLPSGLIYLKLPEGYTHSISSLPSNLETLILSQYEKPITNLPFGLKCFSNDNFNIMGNLPLTLKILQCPNILSYYDNLIGLKNLSSLKFDMYDNISNKNETKKYDLSKLPIKYLEISCDIILMDNIILPDTIEQMIIFDTKTNLSKKYVSPPPTPKLPNKLKILEIKTNRILNIELPDTIINFVLKIKMDRNTMKDMDINVPNIITEKEYYVVENYIPVSLDTEESYNLDYEKKLTYYFL